MTSLKVSVAAQLQLLVAVWESRPTVPGSFACFQELLEILDLMYLF